MAPYFGLTGNALSRAMLWLVVFPAFTCYGYNLTVAGGLLTLMSFVSVFPQLDTINTTGAEQTNNSTTQGTVIALFNVGGIFGALSCIYLGDKLGRRKVILLASICGVVGAVLMASAFGLPQFIIARLIVGFSSGGLLATVPVWQAEIATATKRGASVAAVGVFMGVGVALGLWIDFGLYFVKDSSVSWRFPLAFQLLFVLSSGSAIMFMPESPRWLLKQGRDDEAGDILAILNEEDRDSTTISNDISDIKQSLSLCQGQKWTAMFTMGEQRLFHRMMLAFAAGSFQQLNGINVSSIYATTIFEQYLKMGPINSRVLGATMCMMQIFGGYLAVYTIDRLGRRSLMLWSAAGMAVCMGVLAGTTSVDNKGALGVAVVALFAFQFIFTVGFAGVVFLYATEVAPLQLRAAISAVATAAIWIFAFLLAEITPIGFNTIQYRYYIVFAAANAFLLIPIIYFFFPETSGRTLEEIDQIFMQSKSIWDPPKIAARLPKLQVTEESNMPSGDEEKTMPTV